MTSPNYWLFTEKYTGHTCGLRRHCIRTIAVRKIPVITRHGECQHAAQRVWISECDGSLCRPVTKNKQVPTRCQCASLFFSSQSLSSRYCTSDIKILSLRPATKRSSSAAKRTPCNCTATPRHSLPFTHSHVPVPPGSRQLGMRFVDKATLPVASEGRTRNQLPVSHLP
jgi:hypothetical protein